VIVCACAVVHVIVWHAEVLREVDFLRRLLATEFPTPVCPCPLVQVCACVCACVSVITYLVHYNSLLCVIACDSNTSHSSRSRSTHCCAAAT
jgi:hypothetical protein